MPVAGSEKARVERLILSTEARVRAAFVEFLKNTHDPAILQEVANLLQVGQLAAALNILDSHIVRMASAITQITPQVAAGEIDEFARLVKPFAPLIAFSFDAGDARASLVNRQNQLRLVRQFTEQQRIATRSALSRGLAQGANPRVMARAFRDSIGLTKTQEAAVNNYRSLLEDASADALDRKLRDRRFDPSVRRAANTGVPISGDKINLMVNRYRSRFLDHRAETIARTEGLTAVSQARQEAFGQTLEQAGLQRSQAMRVWNNAGDARVRETHDAMQGQKRGMDQPFLSPSGATLMFPSDPRAPAAERIGCRCWVTYDVASAQAVAA